MQKSLSLKGRKLNIMISKTTKNSETNDIFKEQKKINKKCIKKRTIIPELNLPIKKIYNVTKNMKEKNRCKNRITFEKLKQMILNIKSNKKENKNKKNKKIIKTEIKKDKIKDNNESNYNSENDISLLDKDLFQIRNENKWYKKEYLTEKYNDLIITTENLEKNLNMKYLQGTENIIAEIEEPKYIREDSDINTNTINQNLSLRKHLSIRETTLDTSYRNNSEYNHTENTKGRKKGYFIRIKNYRQLFKKYRTNSTFRKNKFFIKNIKTKNLGFIRYNEHKSDYSNNNSIIWSQKKKNNINNNTYKSVSSYKNKRNIKTNKSEIGQNKKQFLSIISEGNDLIKSEYKNRKRKYNIKNIKEIKNIHNINNISSNQNRKYNSKIASKFHDFHQPINEINPKTLFFIDTNNNKTPMKKTHNTINYNSKMDFNLKDYELFNDIGIGSYAKVKLGINKKNKKKYAIKIYDKNLINDDDKINSIKNEIYILNQLNNENIMKLYDIINTPNNLYLILEYINGISLLDFIQKQKNKKIDENLCKKIFYEIITTILYCTKKNIFHRDIKLENILLIINNENIKIKLIDFGFAVKCNKNEFQNFFCGTLYYMPPEIIDKKKYLPYYSDIWSLGVLLYTMLYGKFPFNGNNDELYYLINKCEYFFPENIDISNEAKHLIEKMIVFEPNKRICLEDIINDIWFKN